jgi:hypothetical protein
VIAAHVASKTKMVSPLPGASQSTRPSVPRKSALAPSYRRMSEKMRSAPGRFAAVAAAAAGPREAEAELEPEPPLPPPSLPPPPPPIVISPVVVCRRVLTQSRGCVATAATAPADTPHASSPQSTMFDRPPPLLVPVVLVVLVLLPFQLLLLLALNAS